MMGVQLLSQLVCEMNQISEADASRSLTKHRKIASSFRDTQLFEIFQLSSTLLRTGQSKAKTYLDNLETSTGLLICSWQDEDTKFSEMINDKVHNLLPQSTRPQILDFPITSQKLQYPVQMIG